LLATGETVVADAQYIRRSIIDPNAQTVAGYPPIMPTYAGQISEEEVLRLVEYIRSLGADEQR
jgi:cytochrome c oxidase subunit 2